MPPNHFRLEWNHKPEAHSVEEVVQCIRDYIKNPQDRMESNTGETFKTLLPDYCIVQEPDTAYHISVRFGKIADRAGPGQVWAYSVHIYLNDNTKKYEPREVIWGNPTPDRPEQSAVYKNRIQWPTGATATTAPPAPGEQPLVSTTSTEGLAPASLPTTNPWGGSIIPSRSPNPPQWGEGPGQGPAAGGGGST
ncbi:hypothetical protein BDDG_05861 [Blastomyces dermatitidis ATCC 18188]|uniref:Uncharacterized protein n=1 Tax=Ajellomyces dermatitidis (strain ATCC 18188 / CBS 674.68) TaxID=653446 RepID=F2TI67_AJEDA|nr:hypothetical protein BDDG_05861 [Blastomyces dermatitidis ATCC 18188]